MTCERDGFARALRHHLPRGLVETVGPVEADVAPGPIDGAEVMDDVAARCTAKDNVNGKGHTHASVAGNEVALPRNGAAERIVGCGACR